MSLDPVATSFYKGLKEAQVAPTEDYGVSEDDAPGPIQVDTPDTVGTIKAPAEKSRPVTKENFFQNHDTHPMLLYHMLSDRYGKEWLQWDTDSLWLTIQRDFPGWTIHDITKDKVNALKTLMVVDSYWQDWEVFEKVTQALNNNSVRFDLVQDPSLGQMMHSVSLAGQLRERKFDEEVGRYVAAVAQYAGVEYLPKPLNFAQPFLGTLPRDVAERYAAMWQISSVSWYSQNKS